MMMMQAAATYAGSSLSLPNLMLRLLNRALQVDSRTAQMSALRREDNVQFQLPCHWTSRSLVRLHGSGQLAVIKRREVDNQVVLDGEDGVGLEPWVVFGVDLSDTWLVALLCDHQVDVCWTHRVTVKGSEEVPGWAVLWEGVCCWTQAVNSVFAVLVRLELSAQVVVRLVVWILEIVFAVTGRLPHVEGGVWDGLAGLHIADDTVHVGDDTILWLVLDDGVTKFSPWCVRGPEGTENSGGSRDVARVIDLDVVGNFSNKA